MNILFHIPNLNQEQGGARQYAITLLKILSEDKKNNYYIHHNNNDSEVIGLLRKASNLHLIPLKIGIERKHEELICNFIKLYNFVVRLKSKKFKIIRWSYLNRICKLYKINILYCPFQYAPLSNTKTIWTLHDLQELHFPEYFKPEIRESRARSHNESIFLGSQIIVSFKHVKNDIIKYFGVQDDKISVCLLDMKRLWFSRFTDLEIDHEFIINLKNKKYVFYAANTWQHKNHINLIHAIAKLKSKGIDINLICTGHQTDFYFENILPIIEKLKIEDNVIFLGVVDERLLYSLYKNAHGVVIPTKYEAGSFPLYESILMEIPVICSNVTSLPEVITDANFLFDPCDIEEIVLKIELLYNDLTYRDLNKIHIKEAKNKLIKNNALEDLQIIFENVSKNVV